MSFSWYFILLAAVIPSFFLCYISANLVFKRHVVKVPTSFGVPLALSFVFLTNLIWIRLHIWVLFGAAVSPESLAEEFCAKVMQSASAFWISVFFYILYLVWPAVLAFFISKILHWSWTYTRKNEQILQGCITKYIPVTFFLKSLLINFFASISSRFILHHLARFVTYNPSKAEPMVDVRSKDGFLYSGRFDGYWLDGREIKEISLVDVIKYDMRDSSKGPKGYMIPNKGNIVLFRDNIADIHFWKLKKGSVISLPFYDIKHIAKLTWYLNLKYSLDLDITVQAYVGKTQSKLMLRRLEHEMARCGLTFKDVKPDFKQGLQIK
jgi:hypothetical protein